jgi:hypothetical protein
MRYRDVEPPEWDAAARELAAALQREVVVTGPELAAVIAYVRGGSKPYFAATRLSLRVAATDRIGEDMVRATYVPA